MKRAVQLLLVCVVASVIAGLLLVALTQNRIHAGGPPAVWVVDDLVVEYSLHDHETPGKDTKKQLRIMRGDRELLSALFRQTTGGFHDVDLYHDNENQSLYLVECDSCDVGVIVNLKDFSYREPHNTNVRLIGTVTKLHRKQ